jgi:hypothetical protein
MLFDLTVQFPFLKIRPSGDVLAGAAARFRGSRFLDAGTRRGTRLFLAGRNSLRTSLWPRAALMSCFCGNNLDRHFFGLDVTGWLLSSDLLQKNFNLIAQSIAGGWARASWRDPTLWRRGLV